MGDARARWYGTTLVIGADDRLPGDLVAALPRERGRHMVLLAGDEPIAPELVDEVIRSELQDPTSIRLASTGGRAGAVAQRLADRAGIEVVAPAGPTMLVAPGALFVASRSGLGAWRIHRPGGRATKVLDMPRHPTPPWRTPLPGRPGRRPGRLSARILPAGYWVTSARWASVARDDPAFAIEIDNDRVVVLVGQPDRRPPSARRLYRWLSHLPESTLGQLTLMPYGPWDALLDEVATHLSTELHVTVRRTAGLPVRVRDTTCYVPVNRAGGIGARSPAQTMSYVTNDPAPRVESWISPVTQRVETGSPVVEVDGRWILEVVRSGYWLREAGASAPDEVRLRPTVVGGTEFVVSASGAESLDLAHRLAARLPADVRSNLRVTQITQTASPRSSSPQSVGRQTPIVPPAPRTRTAPATPAVAAAAPRPSLPVVEPLLAPHPPLVPTEQPVLSAPTPIGRTEHVSAPPTAAEATASPATDHDRTKDHP
ncbi:hypothetical protein EV382_2668 [Micromonospora violae]|uniref:Uncharacterized protein n=1 Tax=Micromonospora violae TaxID=1278207 RepID=A0A4Q7UIQ9_9ACTN|nr:hypothetical protein [Micromonospora violae]RZT79469.1 hypothetical protein EV382_2668 [Micromonospora violae]